MPNNALSSTSPIEWIQITAQYDTSNPLAYQMLTNPTSIYAQLEDVRQAASVAPFQRTRILVQGNHTNLFTYHNKSLAIAQQVAHASTNQPTTNDRLTNQEHQCNH